MNTGIYRNIKPALFANFSRTKVVTKVRKNDYHFGTVKVLKNNDLKKVVNSGAGNVFTTNPALLLGCKGVLGSGAGNSVSPEGSVSFLRDRG